MIQPTYLWRSVQGQRIDATLTDPAEGALFARMFTAGRLTEAGLRRLAREWARGGVTGESFVRFLGRTGRLTPDARRWLAAPDPDTDPFPVLAPPARPAAA